MGREVAVDLHKTQGREAVEPCVGNLLHNLLISFIVNLGIRALRCAFSSAVRTLSPTLSAMASTMLSSVMPYSTPFRETRAISSVLAQTANFLMHSYPSFDSLIQLDLIAILQELLQLRTNLLYIIINIRIRLQGLCLKHNLRL